MKIKNLDKLLSRLDDLSKKQLPYALSRALNNTARNTREYLTKDIKDSFDRPTPIVQRAVRYDKSDMSNLRARVYIPSDEYDQGNLDLASILRHNIIGGSRPIKASEKTLRRLGVLGSNQYIVPGRWAKLDAYGNISAGEMRKILSAAGLAEGSAGYSANQTARSRKRRNLSARIAYCIPFVGVFWRPPGGVKTTFPVLHFTRIPPRYEAERFDFYGAGRKFIKETFPQEFKKTWRDALRTAR